MPDQRSFTLAEAAAELGVRPDDLEALLPSTNIDMSTPAHRGGTLTRSEVERLGRLMTAVHKTHAEGTDDATAD